MWRKVDHKLLRFASEVIVLDDEGESLSAGRGLTNFVGETRPSSSAFLPTSADVARCNMLIDGERDFKRSLDGPESGVVSLGGVEGGSSTMGTSGGTSAGVTRRRGRSTSTESSVSPRSACFSRRIHQVAAEESHASDDTEYLSCPTSIPNAAKLANRCFSAGRVKSGDGSLESSAR
jgi:hypothetical protein